MKIYTLEFNDEEWLEFMRIVMRGAEASKGYGDVKKSLLQKITSTKGVEHNPPEPPKPRDNAFDTIDKLNERMSEFLK